MPMRSQLAAMFAVLLIAAPAAAQEDDILIFGGKDHEKFLGCLSCGEFDGQSVWNKFSTHGWENGFGTWNKFGQFKGEFSPYSACNKFANDPPVLVDRKGNFYGRLSVSANTPKSICGPQGVERICIALRVMCGS
jgi:hypothetical protein